MCGIESLYGKHGSPIIMFNDDTLNCGSTMELLKARQTYPLKGKVHLSKQRIKEFYDHFEGKVYVSFSGGKDSTVLLHLVRSLYPEVPAVFVDTGLEYPEIREFVRTIDNVTWLRPKMPFHKVIEKYGYPVISKQNAHGISIVQRGTYSQKGLAKLLHGKGRYQIAKKWQFLTKAPFKISERCCDIMKKNPMKAFVKETNRHPIMGSMAIESRLREKSYIENGCNMLNKGNEQSKPLAFWKQEDIYKYLKANRVAYCKIYNNPHITRTGCMFCMFGINRDGIPNRFQLMEDTHPKLHDYCINRLGCGKVLDYIKVPYKNPLPVRELF